MIYERQYYRKKSLTGGEKMFAVCLTLIDDEDDRISFEHLYYQYRNMVYAVAYDVLKNSALAEDACSETFLSIAKVYVKIRDLEPQQLKKYVFITVRNHAFNLCREEKMHRKVLPLNETLMPLKDDVLSQYNINFIHECIRKLSDKDREILYLKVTFGFTHREIARHLRISQAAARKRLQSARKNLSKLLKKGEK